KIAAYHFTTLTTNLGMVQLEDGRDFVLADLPGLIAGASQGVGLGFQFLRHVERTRVILHLVEMDPNNGRNPVEDYQQILQELKNYDPQILQRPQVIVATKMDLTGSEQCLAEFKKTLQLSDEQIFPISSVTHQGVREVLLHTAELLTSLPEQSANVEPESDKVYQYQSDKDTEIKITALDDHTYQVISPA
ncbi:GTPase ObgE, partial [Lactobacillus sp. XV13L]|nr:GTPase ObgE [Lactobacillus sp. XV13L]